MPSSMPSADPRAHDVRFKDEDLVVDLVDGRCVSVPLTWFLRLLHATPAPGAANTVQHDV